MRHWAASLPHCGARGKAAFCRYRASYSQPRPPIPVRPRMWLHMERYIPGCTIVNVIQPTVLKQLTALSATSAVSGCTLLRSLYEHYSCLEFYVRFHSFLHRAVEKTTGGLKLHHTPASGLQYPFCDLSLTEL